MGKRGFIFIVVFFCIVFSDLLICEDGGRENFIFVAEELSEALKSEFEITGGFNIENKPDSLYSDLINFINSKNEEQNIIFVRDMKINILYYPYRKFPFFKQKWIRKVYVKAWVLLNDKDGKGGLKSWVFIDELREDPSKKENQNWNWTIGKKMTEYEKIKPGYIEPVLAIGTSLVIVLSLFYVRS